VTGWLEEGKEVETSFERLIEEIFLKKGGKYHEEERD